MSAVSALAYSAWALASLGRWPEALETIDLVQRQLTDANDHIMSLAIAAQIEACRGDSEHADSHLAMLRESMAGVIDTQLLIPYAIAVAESALWRGSPVVAVDGIRYAIDLGEDPVGANVSRYGPIYWLGIRAAADLVRSPAGAHDRKAAALQLAADCSAAMDGIVADIARDTPAFAALADLFGSLCSAERSRLEGSSDPELWAVAAQSQREAERPYTHAYGSWRHAAAALARDGRAPEAREALSEAKRVAMEIDARPLLTEIEQLAARARIDLSESGAETSRRRDPFDLTRREREVLRLMSAGRTNRQIGEELFITEKTASVHVSNILSKLGASRRTEAVALAAELGIGASSTVGPAAGG